MRFSSKLNWIVQCWGIGCGTVRSAVASNTREPEFKWSYWQLNKNSTIIDIIEKLKIKKKWPRMAHIKNIK